MCESIDEIEYWVWLRNEAQSNIDILLLSRLPHEVERQAEAREQEEEDNYAKRKFYRGD